MLSPGHVLVIGLTDHDVLYVDRLVRERGEKRESTVVAELCTADGVCSGGGHRTITVGGVTISMQVSEITPLSAEEKLTLLKYAIRHKGAFSTLLNKCVFGDEATNVKIYPFFGPGAAITKTNIGSVYVNICPGMNGERQAVDLTGCTEFRLMLHANLIGTGAFAARVVRDGDDVVLFESTNLGAAGERELDTNWQSLPATFQNAGLVYFRAQAKSATVADDPIFRSLKIAFR